MQTKNSFFPIVTNIEMKKIKIKNHFNLTFLGASYTRIGITKFTKLKLKYSFPFSTLMIKHGPKVVYNDKKVKYQCIARSCMVMEGQTIIVLHGIEFNTCCMRLLNTNRPCMEHWNKE